MNSTKIHYHSPPLRPKKCIVIDLIIDSRTPWYIGLYFTIVLLNNCILTSRSFRFMKMTSIVCEVSEQDFPWLSSSFSSYSHLRDAPSPSRTHKRSLFLARQDGRGLPGEELAADWLAAQQYSVACMSRCSGSRVWAYMWEGYADTKPRN